MRKSILTILLASAGLLCLPGAAGADLAERRGAPMHLAQQGSHDGHDHSADKKDDSHAHKEEGRKHDHGHEPGSEAEHKGHDHKAEDGHGDHKGHESHEGHDHKENGHKAGDGHSHDEPPKDSGKRSDASEDHDHDHGKDAHAHKDGEEARHGEAGHDHAEGEKAGHGHEAHAGHGDGHGHSDSVKLTPEQMKEFDIATEQAKPGEIDSALIRPAEIKFNQDRVAHVVPRVAGVVREVMASEGDTMEAGTIMAVLDSRELADAKAAYLAAFERMQLAQETFSREEGLWKQKISSEKEYLDARSELAERRIALRAASQKLIALGFDEAFLERLPKSDDDALTQYALVAPFGGTVITRHIARGEAVDSEDQAFLLANLNDIWIDITVYPRDLGRVRRGQEVAFDLGEGREGVRGRIDFVTPHVSDDTRTASARTTIPNPDGLLRPGMFVKARIMTGNDSAAIRVPKTAVQRFEEGMVVFVGNEKGEFTPRPVQVGRTNGEFAEIVSGLKSGETFVSQGAFTLKAQLSKESFGDGHNH